MDLRYKTEWHKEINNGLLPLLELPNGELVKESDVIAEFADDYSRDGLQLLPKDPEQKAKVSNLPAKKLG